MSLSGNDLMGLVGQSVKINRGGPDSIEGVLLSVQSNYLAVRAKDKKIVYVSTTHIKSVTATGQSGGSRSGGMRSGGVQSAMARPIQSYNFATLLQSLQYRHVQINRGGPEKLEGIITNANQNFLVLAVKAEEIVRIPIFHVKSVTVVSRSNNSGGNKSSGNKNNQSGGNNPGGSKSQGNRSQGNQTRGDQIGGNRTWGNLTRGNLTRGNRIGNPTGNRPGNRTGKRIGKRTGNRRGRGVGE
ncbi:hypothetical protein J23TS9_35780 [Paenibacillus sp. J23TS9]|uniref:hypothetical protein n=1 Tax=Paenibacillus sp. J23TS9 TaxID=2807193 RepID=UPI001B07FA1C|nr:hypothetical protein [Paenibacillus sp. J23TS9]GIP28448.1 hypothetical protein J23TS9_35780 [Paenibacillus sp. J23TS9]